MSGETPIPTPPPSGAPPVRTTGGTTRWTPPSPEHLQRLLPQYEILSMVGRGGMGAVYKGRQISLDRLVAIKILPPEVLEGGETADFTNRFKNEARSMARMNHPAIVAVYDFGETGEGQLYIVMEFVDATDVAEMIKSQGRLPPEHALAITAHVCDALYYAHSHGVIHRDIKPANVLMNVEGRVKIADFGLAKATDAGATAITRTNLAMGTPDFIAPEALITGVQVDHRADLYAVGVMLYNMLTGKVPRGVFSPASKVAGTDPRFDAIVTKAMQTEREDRYQSALELRRDLDVILTVPMVKVEAAAHEQSSPPGARKPAAQGPQPKTGGAAPAAPPSAVPLRKSGAGMIAGILGAATLAAGAVFFFANRTPKPADHGKIAATGSFADEIAKLPPEDQVERVVERIRRLNSGVAVKPNATIKSGHLEALTLNRDAASVSDITPVAALKDLKRLSVMYLSGISDLEFARGLKLESLTVHQSRAEDLSPLRGMPLKALSLAQSSVSDLGPVADAPIEILTVMLAPLADLGPARDMPLKELHVEETAVRDLSPIKGKAIKLLWCDPKVAADPINRETLRSLTLLERINDEPVAEFWKRVDGGVVAPQDTAPPSRPVKQSLDLLALADPVRDRVPVPGLVGRNDWRRDGASLSYASDGKAGKLAAPVAIDCRDYEFELRARRLSGGDRIHMDVPLGKGRILPMVLNSPGRKVINEKEGKPWPAASAGLVHVSVRVIHDAAGASGRIFIQRKDTGEVLADWSGDLDKLGRAGEAHPGFPAEPVASIFVMKDPYAVETWSLRIFEGGAKLLREAGPAVAAIPPPTSQPRMPAPPPPVADPRLAQLEAGFKARYESDAQKPFQEQVAALDASYLKALDRALAAATKAGLLDETLALRDEKQRLADGRKLPPADLDSLPANLKQLRSTYRATLARFEADRDKKAAPLYDYYDKALEGYQRELTQQGRIEDALRIKAKRDEVAAEKHPAAEASMVDALGSGKAGGAEAKRANAPPADAKAGGSSSWRRLAEWVITDLRGSVRVTAGKATVTAGSLEDLPPGRFDVVTVYLAEAPNHDSVTDDDLTRLSGNRLISSLSLNSSRVTSKGLAVVKELGKLRQLSVRANVDDTFAESLAGLRELTELTITDAPDFHATKIGDLAGSTKLAKLTLQDCALSDEGVSQVAKLRSLNSLNLHRSAKSVAPTALRALAALKSLDTLELHLASVDEITVQELAAGLPKLKTLNLSGRERTPAFVAAVGRFANLERLHLTASGLTDDMLAPLAACTNLRYVGFSGNDKIHGSGFAALQSLRQLSYIDLQAGRVDDEGLVTLARLPAVETLMVSLEAGGDKPLSAAAVHSLAGSKTISGLLLASTGPLELTRPMLSDLAAMRALKSLHFTSARIDPADLAMLASSKSLTELLLDASPLDDSAVVSLGSLKRLTHLRVAKVTDAGLDALMKALPGCKVER